jgi:hypothetical protein
MTFDDKRFFKDKIDFRTVDSLGPFPLVLRNYFLLTFDPKHSVSTCVGRDQLGELTDISLSAPASMTC